jgi:hypothetical protein
MNVRWDKIECGLFDATMSVPAMMPMSGRAGVVMPTAIAEDGDILQRLMKSVRRAAKVLSISAWRGHASWNSWYPLPHGEWPSAGI